MSFNGINDKYRYIFLLIQTTITIMTTAPPAILKSVGDKPRFDFYQLRNQHDNSPRLL